MRAVHQPHAGVHCEGEVGVRHQRHLHHLVPPVAAKPHVVRRAQQPARGGHHVRRGDTSCRLCKVCCDLCAKGEMVGTACGDGVVNSVLRGWLEREGLRCMQRAVDAMLAGGIRCREDSLGLAMLCRPQSVNSRDWVLTVVHLTLKRRHAAQALCRGTGGLSDVRVPPLRSTPLLALAWPHLSMMNHGS